MTIEKAFRISGTTQPAPPLAAVEVGISSAIRIVPGSSRAAGTSEIEVPADSVARVELENGFVLWSRADDLIEERGRRTLGRDGSDTWEISMAPQRGVAIPAGSRGWLGLGIKVLDFFGVNLKGKAARTLGNKLEEKQLESLAPGLFRCPLDDGFKLTPVPGEDPIETGTGPVLIFIHGTASSCEGSFGKLWADDNRQGAAARARLKELYGERVFALQHRSLTESPITNAKALVARLPPGAEVHLVTHSRGGLVGELLCLAERDRTIDPFGGGLLKDLFAADRTVAEQIGLNPLDKEAAAERDAAYEADRVSLRELLALLDEKQIRVRRFARVACPARGTTLASGRLDRWLSVLSHLAGAGLAADGLDFLLAVIKERTDPRTLPGLEAMMPGSALTRLLQHPDLQVESDLSVIAGDIEGDSLWSQIKLLATDWFYGADHDLVVNTGSMFGGLRRLEGRARFQRDQGPAVNHFSYFANERSIKWLVAALTRADDSDGGFQPLAEARHEEPRWREAVRRSRAAASPRPLAVVIPGTMGSAMHVGGENVWLHYWRLARGGLKRLRIDRPGIEAVDLLDQFYGPLLEFLSRTHRVEVFPYDWRMSVRNAASALAERLEALLPDAERGGQPVHLVAHSMGGLVVRAMIADGGRGAAVWRRITALPNSRFMMLGTPNRGSYEAVRWLVGRNPTQLKLSLLDLTQSVGEIVDIVKAFPGMIELLPFDADDPDFADQGLWTSLLGELRLRWKAPPEPVLGAARATWELMRQAAPDPQHMVYVAGCQPATVADYRVVPFEDPYLVGRNTIEFIGTAQGDGTVTWASGVLPGVRTWYVENAAHDALCARKSAFAGYVDLLMSGTTARLPASPPATARAAAGQPERFPMPDIPFTDDIPDEQAVRAFGFGPSAPPEVAGFETELPVIRVSLRHGDLAYARHPVLVGHYAGDTIVSAEAALNTRLGGALTRRMRLGLYPGALGTHATFFSERPDSRPGGAVVVGLGQVGELSPGRLEACVKAALLDYALQVAEWPDPLRFGPPGKTRSAALSCLLVGSGAGGIAIRDSIDAILRAAVAANARLVEQELESRVQIDELEFLELFEDVAITAAQSLAGALMDGELAASVSWRQRNILEGQGRRRRVRFEEAPAWWHRLEIIREKRVTGDALRFIFATDRARAEETLVAGQLELADDFIRQASRSPSANVEAAKTLFEMLLPNRLKEMAPSQGNLVVMVDPVSARYPWELLEDRWSASGRPPAVAGGLVRQLKTPTFRLAPAHSPQAKAFVVGNPDLNGWDRFPDLPGARQEAEKVAGILGSRFGEVRVSIDETADAILSGLHRDAWRILHLAGHGEHEYALAPSRPGEPERRLSGMVIGRNAFLTPGDVAQMRWVPELVFINCCHLGKTQRDQPGDFGSLAANIAIEFVNMGVKAIVAAGWAVDDEAAHGFAVSFYEHLLAGETFGDAVRAAREEIWSRFPNVNTWGAYQCYGDPGYRIGRGPATPSPAAALPYFSPAELVADLQNYAETARVASLPAQEDRAEGLAELREGIGRLLTRIPEDLREAWLARADIAAAIGFAWGETGAYAEAIEWLNRALVARDGDCPVKSVEQCANFEVRLAGEQWQQLREAGGEPDEARREALVARIDAAIAELDRICRRAPTIERLNLLGSASKRLAWIRTAPAARLQALLSMRDYYGRALELGGRPDPYPFANWGVTRLLVAQLDPKQADDSLAKLPDECQKVIEAARADNAANPSFWGCVAEADCELVRLLATPRSGDAGLKAAAMRIADLYSAAARRGASPRELASVREHLDFVIALSDRARKPLKEALAAIRAAL